MFMQRRDDEPGKRQCSRWQHMHVQNTEIPLNRHTENLNRLREFVNTRMHMEWCFIHRQAVSQCSNQGDGEQPELDLHDTGNRRSTFDAVCEKVCMQMQDTSRQSGKPR
jgi:hypothetical protein